MAILYCQKVSLESRFVQTPAGMWIDPPHLVVIRDELFVVGLRPETGQEPNDDIRVQPSP